MITKDQLFMVFDVESIGLHGEGFAVGWVVVDGHGKTHDKRLFACSQDEVTFYLDKNVEWCERNIPKFDDYKLCGNPEGVRNCFWIAYEKWKEKGTLLVADFAWPVEARFLLQAVDDQEDKREWSGPYPLHDLGSILLAKGIDPLTKFPRLPSELPEHNPLCDARQSARILIEHLFPKP